MILVKIYRDDLICRLHLPHTGHCCGEIRDSLPSLLQGNTRYHLISTLNFPIYCCVLNNLNMMCDMWDCGIERYQNLILNLRIGVEDKTWKREVLHSSAGSLVAASVLLPLPPRHLHRHLQPAQVLGAQTGGCWASHGPEGGRCEDWAGELNRLLSSGSSANTTQTPPPVYKGRNK